MDDILSRFKRKERGSSSSDSETSPQGKRVSIFFSFSVGHNLILNFIYFHTAGALFAYAISGTKSHGLRVR